MFYNPSGHFAMMEELKFVQNDIMKVSVYKKELIELGKTKYVIMCTCTNTWG